MDNNFYGDDSDDSFTNRKPKEKNLKTPKERLEDTLGKEEYSKKIQEKIKEKSTEEWIEIMKIIGLTLEEFDSFLNNKNLGKLIEALELLNRLLNDKNLQIKILEDENENLNKKNYELNKDNIFLFQQNIELKKHLEKSLENKQNGNSVNKTSNVETNESSLINNVSRRMINNSNNLIRENTSSNIYNNNFSNITNNKNSTGILPRLDNITSNNINNRFSSGGILNFNQNASDVAEINYRPPELNQNKYNTQSRNNLMENQLKKDSCTNEENFDCVERMEKNKLIGQEGQDKIQREKIKNFGDTDDFSIEIETNLEMFANKNKNQSRNKRNYLFNIKESYQNEVSGKTGIYSRNKTPNNNSSSRFKTFTDFNNNNSIKNSSSGKSLEINKENLILKSQPEIRVCNNKNNNNYNNNVYLTSKINNDKKSINNNKDDEFKTTNANNFNTNNSPKNLIKINKEFNSNNLQRINNNKVSLKTISKNHNNESSIWDDTFNNSKLQENSELRYRPCKTVENMDLENSRTNNLKRKMIDDMDSIIYNNIEKLFENNINTKQIKKNVDSRVNLNPSNGDFNNWQYKENKKNLINKINREYNPSIMESGVLDESESYYQENENNVYYNSNNKNYINNKNVKSFNCFSKKVDKEKNFYNRDDYSDNYEEPESSQLPNSIINESDMYNDNEFNCNYKDNHSLKDFSINNNDNNDKLYSEEFNKNDNVIKNINLFKNYKIQNSKYINTNLNKENPKNDKRDFNENNAENTIKFGMSTEFRDNINLGESFMSSNMGDIAKMEVTIKHSNN